VFVEVKTVASGGDLLDEYRTFLRHAAVTSGLPAHLESWFIFVAAVPFGVSKGTALWDGRLVDELRSSWPDQIGIGARTLKDRISVLMATQSLEKLLGSWGAAI
jgi:hypothetical protein